MVDDRYSSVSDPELPGVSQGIIRKPPHRPEFWEWVTPYLITGLKRLFELQTDNRKITE
jgi:hypothetical protein